MKIEVETAGYKELRGYIKQEKAKSEEASDFFGNYTNLSTEDLRDLIYDYQYEFNIDSDDDNQTEEEVNTVETSDVEVETLPNPLKKAIALFEQGLTLLRSYDPENQEIADLHAKAMEIEAELLNVD